MNDIETATTRGESGDATGQCEIPTDSREAHNTSPKRSVAAYVILAIVALLIAGAALFWFVRSRGSSAGRPVPAPTNIGQPSANELAPDTKESTITLAPDMVSRGGIQIETVGEQLVSEGAGGPLATGIVQANSYRTTPVVSLVGGIVRRVDVELGQSVKRGQPVAVVFSEELAMAQSRYLAAMAELDEHHQHHHRVTQLVEIGAASREELEQTTAKLRAAESELAAQRQKLLLLGLTPQRIDQLNTAAKISSEVNLPAPVSGTVIGRSANPGEVIPADQHRMAGQTPVTRPGQHRSWRSGLPPEGHNTPHRGEGDIGQVDEHHHGGVHDRISGDGGQAGP